MSVLSLPANRVHISFMHATLKGAIERGIDPAPLLAACNIPREQLAQAEGYVALKSYEQLQERVMALLDDEMFGYGPIVSRLGLWKFACRAAIHEGTLGQVLRRLFEFYDLIGAGPNLRLRSEGELAIVEALPSADGTEMARFAYELYFAAVHRFAGFLAGEPLPLQSVAFRQPGQTSPENYLWLFHTAEVAFGQRRTAFRFDRKWLDVAVQRDSRSLELWLETCVCGFYEGEAGDQSWSARVREVVRRGLPELPEFHEVAAQLLVNPHTLRRRLTAEGLGYQGIKDQVRREAAEYYLMESALPVEEIAYRSGFSEASCFIRAFKRWTGMTPHLYARRNRGRLHAG